jgi:hypothetical protein
MRENSSMRHSWNKGQTKETNVSVAKTSATMKDRGLDNFKAWREQAKREGKIKSEYLDFERNGDLAELLGVVLGDGHICKHERCESLRITGDSHKPEFIYHYAVLIEKIFQKTPTIANVKMTNAMTVTIYEKHISTRLGIPAGSRHALDYILPEWISVNRAYRIRFLRGLYEAEGNLSYHAGTYTHKFQFGNINVSLLDIVHNLVIGLGFHPHRSPKQIQVSRKAEVQKLADLLQFRNYGSRVQ